MQKASFSRKAVDIGELKNRICEEIYKDHFVIEKVIELTTLQYKEFEKDLLSDFDFIKDNNELMYIDNDRIWHTILIKEEGKLDGILVESEGYDYARYAAYFPGEEVKA